MHFAILFTIFQQFVHSRYIDPRYNHTRTNRTAIKSQLSTINSLSNVIGYGAIISYDIDGVPTGVTGGLKLGGAVNAHTIYYSTVTNTRKTLVSNFINNIANTPWWANLNGYYRTFFSTDFGGFTYLVGQTATFTETTVNYPTSRCSNAGNPANCYNGLWHGKRLQISDATNIINYMISNSLVTYSNTDTDIYTIILGDEISYTNDLGDSCSDWSSFHAFNSIGLYKYPYQVLNMNPCKARNLNPSPNNDAVLDHLVDELAGNLAAIVTNPDGTGWYTPGLGDAASLCKGSYIQPFTSPNGISATQKVGNSYYYIQDLLYEDPQNYAGTGCINKEFIPYKALDEQVKLYNVTTDVTLPIVKVHLIYYGLFNSGQKALIQGFISGISSTSYWSTVYTYYTQTTVTGPKIFKNTKLVLGNVVDFGNALGYSKYGWTFLDVNPNSGLIDTTSTTGNVIVDVVAANLAPQDSSATYTVLLSGNVTSDQICGHDVGACSSVVHSTMFAWPFTFVLTGDHSKCQQNGIVCTPANDVLSPNMALTGDIWTDNMLDSLIHELSNTVFTPNGFSWVGGSNTVVGDYCNQNYISTYLTPNGATANINFGGFNYLIQSMWQNGYGCVMTPKSPIILPFVPKSVNRVLTINKARLDV